MRHNHTVRGASPKLVNRLLGPRTRPAPPRPGIATLAAIGLLAYVSADIAHHALGHGAACLALQGQTRSLGVFDNAH
jgi:hypothetical protein